MDPRQFDDLVKRLSVGTTRRNALKIFGGGIMAGTLGRLRSSSADAAPAGKVGICHHTGSASNPVVYITVSANAIPAHQAHGDAINPNFQTDPANCGGCSISCDDGNPCTVDTCVAGACVHTPVDCSKFTNACNVGVCSGGTCSAQPTNEGGACLSGDLCTTDDTCASGVCVPGPAVDCDDGDVCTADSCDATSGACINAKIDGCCHDNTECPENLVCVDNVCVDNPNPECAGANCSTFIPCSSSNPDCVCGTTEAGGGFCVPGSTGCAGLTDCTNGQSDCAVDEVCLVGTCCGNNVCVPLDLNGSCPADTGAKNSAGITEVTECTPGTIACPSE